MEYRENTIQSSKISMKILNQGAIEITITGRCRILVEKLNLVFSEESPLKEMHISSPLSILRVT